ncbi:MAG: leucine-rich repeat protein, partial [Clostridia bacterium]|nr:leucine-rich repeat protein [Clostridia bacterium]
VLVIPDSTKTEFVVPANVVTIGSGAFSSLSKLEKVEFAPGSQLTTIEENAFAGCSTLTTAVLPEKAISIKEYVFYATSELKTIDLSMVTDIGTYAFAMSYLKNVDLSNVQTICDCALYGNQSLETVKLAANVNIGKFAFAESAVKTVDLLGDATIGDSAFYSCAYLTSFDFSEVTGKIGNFAFYKCLSHASVVEHYVT